MKTTIYKINDPVEDIDKLKKAADCLNAGGLVVFPTETVYGIACKADEKSLARLDKVKQRDSDKRYSLHLGDKDKISRYVPHLTPTAKKLIQKTLPGPITIVFELNKADIAKVEKRLVPLETGRHARPSGVKDALSLTGLSAETVNLLYRDNTIGIRCPDEATARALLNLCDFPIIAPSANISGHKPATDAAQAAKQLDGLVDIILDAGHCKLKKHSTVVKISAQPPLLLSGERRKGTQESAGVVILRAGAISEEKIRRFATVNILFVCTGNTCRSPMAEGLAKKAIAEKLKCNIDRLADMGYKTTSAGVAAVNGFAVSPESVRFCASRGIDIASHRSRRLTSGMLDDADYIFAMSPGHLDGIIRSAPAAAVKCQLLEAGGNIDDPIGGGPEIYTAVGSTIERAINKRIGELFK
jgi:L-threonylcarbamoyladenylate synthase